MRPLEILLAEDNHADVRWLQILLEEAGFLHRLCVVRDGQETLQYLEKDGQFAAAPDPDLILLDLNLPKLHGVEILKRLKERGEIAVTPVCVLTGSPIERMAVIAGFEMDIRCYVVKPLTIQAFIDALNSYDSLKPFLAAWRGSGAHG